MQHINHIFGKLPYMYMFPPYALLPWLVAQIFSLNASKMLVHFCTFSIACVYPF